MDRLFAVLVGAQFLLSSTWAWRIGGSPQPERRRRARLWVLASSVPLWLVMVGRFAYDVLPDAAALTTREVALGIAVPTLLLGIVLPTSYVIIGGLSGFWADDSQSGTDEGGHDGTGDGRRM